MNPKTQAREFALQFLYQSESEKIFFFSDNHFNSFFNNFEPSEKLRTPLMNLCRGTLDNLERIDSIITESAVNWSISRMTSIDRNVLRLATYELLESDTPVKVVLNEAIELAKKYGSDQSGSFVNGLLDKLAGKLDKYK